MPPMGDNVRLVFDDPFDDFSLFKLQRLRNRGGKVDIVLVSGFLPADELNFRRVSHVSPPVLSALAYLLEHTK